MAETLSITPVLFQKYLAAAEKIANLAVYGPDLKPEPVRFDIHPGDGNHERIKITKPAYYSTQNYDTAGLSMPGSYH